ncbi:GspH/FimT family pseudopilin [Motilimonas sp. E26]|uniref:GspH/FimT family pseudopilin n=2 Tax=Alteromonadales genera incertae sedis TaxID=256005 RepID=UPI00249F8905|nr:GspH/FimT family pseudopilin [Motilimonas sp. E26]MDO6526531.1 GspH/FimT family pseudopilin [Motilimonas sp. 1_MG-2023]
MMKQQATLGFNLIELMVTIAIVMILALVAVPSYQSVISTERFTSATNNLYNAYRFSRSEAIKTATPIQLKPINNDWANGWQVLDLNNKVLHETGAPHSSIKITGNAVKVLGTGALNSATSFSIKDKTSTRYICVLSSGQSQLQAGACS